MLSFISKAFAAESNSGITNPLLPGLSNSASLGILISRILDVLLLFGFVLALFHFMFGAIRWITASGDKAALQNAQDRITQAVVGMIILAAAWAAIIVISVFLGWRAGPAGIQFTIPKLGG